MKPSLRLLNGVLFWTCGALAVRAAIAEPVTWTVDSSASYVELTVPDQIVPVTGFGNVTLRLRDAGDDNQWTDAGGRRAALAGQIVTDYVNFTSIQFVGGSQNLYALEQTELRPNPADWDPATSSYGGTSTAPAAFGARARATYTIIISITSDVGFLAIRQVQFDIASPVVPVTGGVFAGSQTDFGIFSAVADVDGLSILNQQPIPDLLNEPVPPDEALNVGRGVIENLGGRSRRLTYDINVPVVIQLDTVTITGTAAGQIVAYATIPEQSIPFDFDGDGDVDGDDYAVFLACASGPGIAGPLPGCTQAQFDMSDADRDLDVDQDDFGVFQRCFSGKDKAARQSCAQ
jgi:hypothetical protein